MNFQRKQKGMALIALLLFVAATGVAAACLVRLGEAVARRQVEAALIDAGQEFSNAFSSYRGMTPAGMPDQPATLEELLRDTRFPGNVRHLRKLYSDPVTGSERWGLFIDPQTKRIAGVYSRSNRAPLKTGNFPRQLESLSGQAAYSDWVFTADLSLRIDAKAATRRATRGSFSPLDLIEAPPAPPQIVDPNAPTISPLDLIKN